MFPLESVEEYLDAMLVTLNENYSMGYTSYDRLSDETKLKGELGNGVIFKNHFDILVKKLIKDKNAEKQNGTEQIRITADEQIFIIEGGYTAKLNKENDLKNRIEKNENLTLVLSKWVAVGSIGILLIEVVKFVFDRFCNC